MNINNLKPGQKLTEDLCKYTKANLVDMCTEHKHTIDSLQKSLQDSENYTREVLLKLEKVLEMYSEVDTKLQAVKDVVSIAALKDTNVANETELRSAYQKALKIISTLTKG